MKKFYFLAIIAVALMVYTGCKKEEQKPELPDISIVDISQESGWDSSNAV